MLLDNFEKYTILYTFVVHSMSQMSEQNHSRAAGFFQLSPVSLAKTPPQSSMGTAGLQSTTKAMSISKEKRVKLRQEALDRGVILPAGQGLTGTAIWINPPLVITRDQFDEGVAVLDECLNTL